MFDFGENLPTMLDKMRGWGQYYGEVENRAQQEWTNRASRDAVDRENRMNREIGAQRHAAYQQNAGLFDNRNGTLQGLRRNPVPPLTRPDQGTTGTAGVGTGNTDTGAGSAALTEMPNYSRSLSLTRDEMNGLFQHRGGRRLGFREYTETEIANNPTLRDILQRGQQYMQLQIDPRETENGVVYRVQQRTQGTISDQNFAVPQPNTILGVPISGEDARNMRGSPALPLNLEWGRNVRENAEDIALRSRTTNTDLPGGQTNLPAVDPRTDLQTNGAQTPAATNASVDPLAAFTGGATQPAGSTPWYLGTSDTSRALQMNPQMQLMDVAVRDNLMLADTYARYGRNDLATQAFNMALTGQASIVQQENLTLLRGFASGNLAAGAALIANLNGYPDNAVRLRPTDEAQTRFVLEIQDEQDPSIWRSAYETPLTRAELYSSLEAGADATSWAARQEADRETRQELIRARTQLTIAQGQREVALLRLLNEAQIAQFREVQETSRQYGRPQLASDGEGGVYVVYRDVGANGQVEHRYRQLRMGDVQTPNVDGEQETTQGLIVTGTAGVGAQ